MIATAWVMRVVFVPVFFLAFGWALYKFNVTGDGRWWLTIISAPLFGAMTLGLAELLADNGHR